MMYLRKSVRGEMLVGIDDCGPCAITVEIYGNDLE